MLHCAGELAHNNARITASGIDTVVGAMRAHRGVVGVQQQGCSALAKFVNDNADNQARITAAGGVEALVRAMGAHAGSEGVQHEGCSLQGAGEPRQQQYRQPGQDRGGQGLTDGIDAVVGAMSAHRGSRSCRRWAARHCCVLSGTMPIAAAGGPGIDARIREPWRRSASSSVVDAS